MSAAAALSPSAPLVQEGNQFWQQLTEECRRQVEDINAVVSEKGLSPDQCVHCTGGRELRMFKAGTPSTLVKVLLGFYSWGPMLSVAITGQQTHDSEFFPEECEMPIAVDADGSIIAIFDEGRSFSPREMAAYLTQAFRRCFPGVCLCR
ncbi:MAG TPA: hypothetical protein VKX25_22265 [Bryobacteraceae bacterium]|jgi:hypothetical protein|nr:hypothetical protein [Bryobacteraceae bacterium]